MSTIPNYDEDIFISYAHIDNQPLVRGASGWVDTLHERLRIRLEQVLGEQVAIWRDRKLQGNDVFSDVLLDRLTRVAIMVSVLSPRYIRSEWCMRELSRFCAAENGDGRIADKSRVFKVIKTHIPRDSHPPELQDSLGYEFYEYDRERNRAIEFETEAPSRDLRYWERLNDLAYDIKNLIESLKAAADPEASAHLVTSRIPIYLAETTSDLAYARNSIKRELQQHGHIILPDEALPLVSDRLSGSVREHLGRSMVSVHLLGDRYGIVPEGGTKSVGQIQLELALERGDNLQRVVWIPNGVEPKDDAQNILIRSLQDGSNVANGVEVAQTSLEDLKTIIHDVVSRVPRESEDVQSVETVKRITIYLIHDRQDSDAVRPIADYLFSIGFEVILPALEGQEGEIVEDHKESLIACDAVLIYYGQSSEIWLRMKQRELQKVSGYGRPAPFLTKGIYIGGPPTDAKERLREHDSVIIRHYGDFDPVLLESYTAQLLASEGGQQ